jgi:predicted phage-related endonuclease
VDRLVSRSKRKGIHPSNCDRILEIKTARTPDGWPVDGGSWENLPAHYICQVLHYAGITRASAVDVAVLIGASDFRRYQIPIDTNAQELIDHQRRYAIEWWQRHIIGDMAPPPRDSAEAVSLFAGRRVERAFTTATEDQVKLVEEHRKLSEVERRIKEIETELKASMADTTDLADSDGNLLVTWRSSERTGLDTARLKSEHPEIYNSLQKTQVVRTFVIKKEKSQ